MDSHRKEFEECCGPVKEHQAKLEESIAFLDKTIDMRLTDKARVKTVRYRKLLKAQGDEVATYEQWTGANRTYLTDKHTEYMALLEEHKRILEEKLSTSLLPRVQTHANSSRFIEKR